MNTRSNQTIFNYFCRKFFKEETPKCEGDYDTCRYAPQNKTQIGCAVGCLLDIEDAKEIDRVLDGYESSVKAVAHDLPDIFGKYFDVGQTNFLMELQNIHDCYLPIEDVYDKRNLANKLIYLADQHNLTVYKYVKDAANDNSWISSRTST